MFSRFMVTMAPHSNPMRYCSLQKEKKKQKESLRKNLSNPKNNETAME